MLALLLAVIVESVIYMALMAALFKRENSPYWQTAYRDTEVIIRYIRDQEVEDNRLDQLELPINKQTEE